jgi:hypothetical protein
MRETLKRRKRASIRHKQSRKRGGISKKYKSLRGNNTKRLYKITKTTYYDNAGNLIGGGIFDFFRLKINVRKIKGIIGKLNVLEKDIKKEIDSYGVQSDLFKKMAEKTAQYQTEYIIAKRRNVILKNYRKDTEEINQKTDKNVLATINHEIEKSDSDYKHAEKMVAAQYKEVGGDIKNFLYLSAKYQKELLKFAKVDKLRKQVETYQLEISHIRDKAIAAEGRTDLGKAEKAIVAKYKKNKKDYDYVVSLTNQDLENITKIQQKAAGLTATMEHYKNQFGMYKREGYESKGKQGSIKIGGKIKAWAELTDKLAESLLGVYDKTKEIITVLEEIKTSITKCRTELVTVPEYINKEANANAILWFEHDVEDMIKVVKELKKHFGEMKNEFYNQISAENMYSNYNYNSKFLRVIEIRLRFYEWMIDRAFDKDTIDKKRDVKSINGGYYSLIGGAPPGPRGQKKDACDFLKKLQPFNDTEISHLAKSLKNITQGLDDASNACYNLNKDEFIKCIENKYNRYLLLAFLNSNILDGNTFNNNADLKKGIQTYEQVIKTLNENTDWNDSKKKIAEKFSQAKIKSPTIDPPITAISKSKSPTKKLTDLYDDNGNPITGLTTEETAFQKYLLDSSRAYLKKFLISLKKNTNPGFYGVLDYDKETNGPINNYITNLPPDTGSSATTATAASTTNATNTSSNRSFKFNDKLDSKELNKINQQIKSIGDGLEQFGINPSSDFKDIVKLLNDVRDAVDNVFNSLKDKDNNTPDISIKGLSDFKEYLLHIKSRVDLNDIYIEIDEDNDEYLENMKQDLENFNSNYQLMSQFYKSIKDSTDSSTAKKALNELINEYTKDVNDKESISKIAIKIADKPDYKKKPTSSLPASLTAASAPTTSTTTSTTTSENSPIKPVSNPISNAKEKEEKDMKERMEKIPPWLADLDTRSKNNKDYISNILIRIPNEYPKQYNEVKAQLKEMLSKIKLLSSKGNTLANLSDDFQTMTTTLIDIKAIESDLIDVKVKAEPKRLLGLGNYIPDPLSLEKKSQAREDTKRISELVKGMMQNTFFEDRGDKDKETVEKLFDRVLANLSKDYPPNISYEEQTLLRKPYNLDIFIEKLKKSIINAGITSEIAQGRSTNVPYEIQDSQKKFCRLIGKLKDITTDTIEVNKILNAATNVGDCYSLLSKDNKGKGGQGGQSQRGQSPWQRGQSPWQGGPSPWQGGPAQAQGQIQRQ